MAITVDTPKQLKELIGEKLTAKWAIKVTQSLIDDFCAVSGDRQWIHTADAAAIVPGNMLITLLPQLIQSTFEVLGFEKCVTAKYQNVKFLQPVYADELLGLTLELASVKTRKHKTYVEMHCQLTNGNAVVVEASVTDVYYHAY